MPFRPRLDLLDAAKLSRIRYQRLLGAFQTETSGPMWTGPQTATYQSLLGGFQTETPE